MTLVPKGANRLTVWETPTLGALIEAFVIVCTAVAAAVNVALVIPAPMVTDAGTVRLELVEVRPITWVDCAGLPRLNVQVLDPGVCMDAGVHTRVGVLDAAEMLSEVPRTTPAIVAVIVAVPDALAPAEAVKPADVAPAPKDTEPGTVTCGLLLLSVAVTPPTPAGPVMTIVQLLELPAATVAGVQLTEESVDCAATASVKVAEFPL